MDVDHHFYRLFITMVYQGIPLSAMVCIPWHTMAYCGSPCCTMVYHATPHSTSRPEADFCRVWVAEPPSVRGVWGAEPPHKTLELEYLILN